jgi:hypothetical protein
MKKVIGIVIAVALVAVIVIQQRKIGALQAQTAKANAELAVARQELQRADEKPKVDANESERVNQERAELARLRGEVSALRKEKAEWQKSRGIAESAAIAATQPVVPPPAATPAVEGMQWVETILNGPSQVKGTEVGNVRRKALNGEPMTEAERALLMNMNSKSAEVEKSPEEFANFQSAFIGSLLGWTNDVRSEQVKGMLNAAMNAANARGYDYHAPAENADKWADEQKALNTRATSAIQNLLKPEERAVFDKAFIGVLGVDTGTK